MAVLEQYKQEYDLHYQSVDKELHKLTQSYNDPRLIARAINQEYDITDATDDYYLLNGRAFPYTLRESLLVVEPDQKVKLRILNGHTETMAVHIHGHKATETHYDGVPQRPEARVTREVYMMAPAQRLDLELNTTNDGLHNFGPGIWMFHDHVEKAFTTDGVGEGGSISLVVYKAYLDEKGLPKTHGMDLKPYFTKQFWERKVPVWQDWGDDWGSLALPAGSEPSASAPSPAASTAATSGAAPAAGGGAFGKLILGILLGTLGYFLYLYRSQVIAVGNQLLSQFRNKT